jgi:hypothetical protein
MIRREFVGSALRTTLSADISNSATSFSVASGSTFPSGSNNPFVISIGRGTASEEKILCSSRTTNTFTVSQRGYDGTTASAHTTGEYIDHVLDAVAIQNMNTYTYDTSIIAWMGI